MSKLMTVGELAKRIGVTVRTIQYYDQKGLLHPSQLGEGNQRFYSDDDEVKLRRILVLKYLGLSLSDIAERPVSTVEEFQAAIDESQEELSKEIVKSFERMSSLKALSNAVEKSDEVDWMQATQVIDLTRSNTEQFWEQIAESDGDSPSQAEFSRQRMLEWHALMGDTIEAMQEQVDPQSERGRALGARFSSLGGREMALKGLGHMSAPGKVMSSMNDRGRAFYQKLQAQALEFLEQASRF